MPLVILETLFSTSTILAPFKTSLQAAFLDAPITLELVSKLPMRRRMLAYVLKIMALSG
jgi:hypothetical protein